MTRMTLRIPPELSSRLIARAAAEGRTRHAQILVFTERGLETPTDAERIAAWATGAGKDGPGEDRIDRAAWFMQVAENCLATRRVPLLHEGPPGLTGIQAEADWAGRKVHVTVLFENPDIAMSCSRPMPLSWLLQPGLTGFRLS